VGVGVGAGGVVVVTIVAAVVVGDVVVVAAGVVMEVSAVLPHPVSMVTSRIMTRIKVMAPDNLIFKFNSISENVLAWRREVWGKF
jgi:hypothetical protein